MNFSFKSITGRGKVLCRFSRYKTYRILTKAPLDILWKKLINIADVSWHPLFARTNLPYGLIAKPGLFYQVVTHLMPIPIKVFVEKVSPGKVLSIRFLLIPGMEQRIIYKMESTLKGTFISYSVALKGWLSPVIWWLIRPYSDQVVNELAQAAEDSV